MNTSQVVEWGKGDKVIVFLHYFGGAADSWTWVAEHLASDYRCIALNLPGFGERPPLSVPSIENFTRYVWQTLDQMKIDRFTLVGHSMSGKFALQMAADDTDNRIDQVVLVAPSPPTIEPMPEKEKERMLKHPFLQTAETTVKKVTIKPISQKQRSLAIDTQMIIDNRTWRWWLEEGMKHSIAEQMSKVHTPVTVLASKDDPAIPYKTVLSEVIDIVPGAKLISVEGVGHLLPIEVPELVASVIDDQVTGKATIAA